MSNGIIVDDGNCDGHGDDTTEPTNFLGQQQQQPFVDPDVVDNCNAFSLLLFVRRAVFKMFFGPHGEFSLSTLYSMELGISMALHLTQRGTHVPPCRELTTFGSSYKITMTCAVVFTKLVPRALFKLFYGAQAEQAGANFLPSPTTCSSIHVVK